MDAVTQNWHIPAEYRSEWENIKDSYHAIPLHIFHNRKAVPMRNVKSIIEGAIVEIQFELRHFPIKNKTFNSFNASLLQVQILEPGQERPPTLFKRKNMDEGPIQLTPSEPSNDNSITHKKPRLQSVNVSTPSTSTHTVTSHAEENDNDDSLLIEETILQPGTFRLTSFLSSHYNLRHALEKGKRKCSDTPPTD